LPATDDVDDHDRHHVDYIDDFVLSADRALTLG